MSLDPLGVPGATLTERFVPVEEGVGLRVLSWTPERPSGAAPVLFVAGWVSAVEGWLDLLRALAPTRPVHYLETREKRSARMAPGFRLTPAALTIDRMAEDVRRVWAALGLEGAVVMGSSLGASVLLEAMKGGRLAPRAAFLVGPNVRFRYPWWGHLVIRLPSPLYHLVKHPILFYLRHFRVDARREPEQMRRYEATILGAHPARIRLSAIAFSRYEAWPELGTIGVPVGVAYASSDVLHGEADVARLVEALPRGERVPCPSNKHMHSAALARDLDAFLAAHATRGSA